MVKEYEALSKIIDIINDELYRNKNKHIIHETKT
jgi:hypothetical protein